MTRENVNVDFKVNFFSWSYTQTFRSFVLSLLLFYSVRFQYYVVWNHARRHASHSQYGEFNRLDCMLYKLTGFRNCAKAKLENDAILFLAFLIAMNEMKNNNLLCSFFSSCNQLISVANIVLNLHKNLHVLIAENT